MRKRRSDPVPFTAAVFLLVIGILLGSVFTFGSQYWNKKVSREACTLIDTDFVDYTELRHIANHTKIKEIAIDCSNGERYFIDGVSINDELRTQLSLLSAQENITLLIHPNSNTIVEFSSDNAVLLDFNDTIDKLDGEATGFIFLGLFMYFCALVGLYYTVYHIIRRKKRRR